MGMAVMTTPKLKQGHPMTVTLPAMTSEPELNEEAQRARQIGDAQGEKDALRAAAFAVHMGWPSLQPQD